MIPPRALSPLWAPLCFLLASLALNWALLSHLTDTLPGNAGDPMLNAWILGWVSDAALTQPLEIWDAPIFHPTDSALALSEHLFGIAVFVAPVYWITQSAILTYNVAFLLGFAFLGWSTFHLTRTLTGRTDAAVVAGLAVMTSPYFTSSQVARLQMLSAGWSVLAWSLLWRWRESLRWPLLAGAAACWIAQCYSNTYLGLFLAMPAGIVAVFGGSPRAPRLTLRALGALVLAGAVVALTVLPVLLEFREAQAAYGLAHPESEVERYSARVSSYARVWHDRPDWPWRDVTSDRALFPGVLLAGLGLAGAAQVFRRRSAPELRRAALVLSVIAVATAAFTLGPTPMLDRTPLGVPGPYAMVTALVPSAEGIRAPGRFAVFVMLALGGLAGLGAAAFFAHAARGRRIAGLALAGLAAFWSGHRGYDWLAHLEPTDPSSAAAYAWLAAQPPSVLIEFPVVTHFQAQRPNAGASVTLRYQMAALEHGHRLVNGSSGFVTPLVTLLQSPTSPFTTLDTVDDAVRLLRGVGTRYIVLHRHEYAERWQPHVEETVAFLRSDGEQVEDVREFGSTVIFTLRPSDPTARPVLRVRVPRAEYTLAVSHDHSSADHLADGDADTRWQAPQHGVWIEAQLRRARPLSGVKLEMPRHAVGDYPHHLRVVGRSLDGHEVVLYDGPGVVPTALSTLHEPAAPGLRITWPTLPLSSVRIEQPHVAANRRWTVHEMHLLTDQALN